MKKSMFLFGALFAVGLSFTACSSDNDVAENNGPIDNGGSNYLAISINLPTNPAANTRTGDNGNNVTLEDGLATEYAVNNATLIIFNSSGEFVEAHDIATKPWTSSSDDQVTRVSTKIVQPVSGNVVAGCQMLVILNDNGLIDVTGSNGLQVMKNGSLTDFTGSYLDLLTQANSYLATTTGLDCGDMKNNGFYMANAPLADKMGSTSTAITGATVQVLVPITTVYTSEALASAGTADQIYVERGMAKVTMDEGITTTTLSNSKIGGSTNLIASLAGWALDNCNKASYLVRSTDGHSDFLNLISNSSTSTAAVYRYIGNTVISEGSPTTYKYRTYFAKSANYDKSSHDASTPTYLVNRVTGPSDFSTSYGTSNPKYCFENTFSVADQDVNKTTLVQVAIQAIAEGGSAADLYTVGGNKSNIYLISTLQTLIQSKAYEYLSNNSKVKSGTLASTDISVSMTVGTDNSVTGLTLTYSTSSGATLYGSAFSGGVDGTNDGTSGTLADAVGTYVLNETGEILKYENGVSYYNIRIKHFGDILTPWKENETPKPNATNGIYPSTNADNNYLGRYGVLRNNWYHLKVNTIKSLGEANPHTGTWPSTPDDELDSYITFQINILSWAKHVTQNADL